MTKLLKTAFSLLLLACCTQLQAQTAADEAAVYALFTECGAAFHARDADRYAAIFTENAEFIPPVGTVLHGRETIRQAHLQLFKNFPKPGEVTHETLDRKLRFLAPDLALATVHVKSTETKDGVQESDALSLSLVARRVGDQWLAELLTLTPATRDMAPPAEARN